MAVYFSWLIVTGKRPGPNPVLGTPTHERKSREKMPTTDETRAIWAALPPPGYDYGDMVRLLFLLGPRRTEIAELTRAEVNFAERQIELGPERTKSKRPFIIPLSAPALAILKARADRTGLMFGRGENVFSAWSWYKVQLDARSGVTGWTLHDARRLLNTSLAEKKKFNPPVEPHVREALLGHVPPGVKKHYDHAQYVQQKREALRRWGAYLLKMVGATPARPKRPRRSKQELAASAP